MTIISGTRFDDVISATSRQGDILKGLVGNDTFEFYGMSQEDRFVGGRGDDTLTGIEIDIEAAAFETQALGTTFVGGRGVDTVEYSISVTLPTLKLGSFGMKLNSVEFRDYDLTLTGNYAGPEDTFKILGKNAAEIVAIRDVLLLSDIDTLKVNLRGGNDTLTVDVGSLDHIFVNTGGGGDTVVMYSSVDGAVINLGAGNDRIIMDSYHRETVKAGKGNDTIVLDHALWTVHTDTVTTGGGRDKIIVGGQPIVTAPLGNVVDFNAKRDKIGLAVDGNGTKPFDVVYSQQELTHELATNPDAYRTEYWLMDNKAGTLGFVYNGAVKEVLDFGGSIALDDQNFFKVDENYGYDFLL